MKEKYLPIGSVVTLKDATKKIMIIGYCPVEKERNQMYDYSACLYPEGVIDSNRILLFNHNQIATIHFIGLEDEKRNNRIGLDRNDCFGMLMSGTSRLGGSRVKFFGIDTPF